MDKTVFWAQTYRQEHLINSPCRREMPIELELRLKNHSVQYIYKSGTMLKLPYQAIATACVYLHHFYMHFLVKENEKYNVANACIFLASKSEECRKSLKDIIRCQFYLRQSKSPQKNSKTYMLLHDAIIISESKLLQAIDFCFSVSHPFQFIHPALQFLFANSKKSLGGKDEQEKVKGLSKLAWNFANDSYRNTVCLFHPPQHVALACVELAFRYNNCVAQIFGKDEIYVSLYWWEIFDDNLSENMLLFICDKILAVYNEQGKYVKMRHLSNCLSFRENPPLGDDSKLTNK